MSEHTFDQSPSQRDRDARATERALTLCETLLDDLAAADHDWVHLRDLTLRLSRIASAMAGPPPGRSLPRR